MQSKKYIVGVRSFIDKMDSKLDITNIAIIFLLFLTCVSSMTRQQLKNSGKLLKKTCMPKHDVTEDQVGDIEQGKFLEDRNVMCYIACVYSMSQAVKNNKIMHDNMIKQVDMMFPPDIKDAVKDSIENCRPVAKNYKDVCKAAFWTAKCMYDYNPANFVFV